MEFTLTYRGELKGNGSPQHKHELRQCFHRQLAELWRQPPLVGRPTLAEASDSADGLTLSVECAAFRFIPLVSTRLHGVTELDILLLREGPPGQIIGGGGDIDNRLKTLFDALKMPSEQELPKAAEPGPAENPFYCLCEDDKLVASVRVQTDRLLDARDGREVLLVIRVVTKFTTAILANMGL